MVRRWIAGVMVGAWLGVSGAAAAAEESAAGERLVRAELELSATKEKITKLEGKVEELTKQRDYVLVALSVGGTIVAVLSALFWVSLRKRVNEKGFEGLVDAAVDKLLKDDASRMTGAFEGLKAEILRKVRCKDKAIALVGEQDAGRVKAALERLGFTRFVERIEVADVIVFLGAEVCKKEYTKAINDRRPAVVLYSPGVALPPGIIEELSERSVATFAQTPVTAAQHAATLLMLTQSMS
ncbi:hypothetical protein [Polyangium mundeleinium]|uniref:Uncharacterized protein n=1 Tax=Polyangium mundeleinium TaxID=2995306 RepID=A0ABT5EI29_9BACT|nr:hypothetical protein [Polyangium mundeleinium]MDC0741480.1 hypothetical protein [Polyangium mundeleinium]